MDPLGRQSMMTTGVPTASVIPAETANANPVTAGSIVGLPVGSLVHVNVNGNLVPVRTVPAPMTSVQTSVNVPTYTTTSVPVQTTTSVVQTAAPEGNPTPTVRTLPPRIVRNQLAPKYNTVTLPPKVVQTRLAPILPPPTPQLSIQAPPVQSYTLPPQTVPTTFATQSITVPPVQSVTIPNTVQSVTLPPRVQSIVRAPVTAPTQTLSVQAPLTTTTTSIMPTTTTTYGTASVGQNIPFGTASVPMTIPYGTASAPITTTTYGTASVGAPQYTTFGNSTVVGNAGVPIF